MQVYQVRYESIVRSRLDAAGRTGLTPLVGREQEIGLLRERLRIAAQQPVLFIVEDLHWVDPTTLELLTLLVHQGATARILALLTSRPDFRPPWRGVRT
jgi:hypothetical protein